MNVTRESFISFASKFLRVFGAFFVFLFLILFFSTLLRFSLAVHSTILAFRCFASSIILADRFYFYFVALSFCCWYFRHIPNKYIALTHFTIFIVCVLVVVGLFRTWHCLIKALHSALILVSKPHIRTENGSERENMDQKSAENRSHSTIFSSIGCSSCPFNQPIDFDCAQWATTATATVDTIFMARMMMSEPHHFRSLTLFNY